MDIFSLLQCVTAKVPMRLLKFNGRELDCLCDSGACTTVVRYAPPYTEYSKTVVWVKSASGHVKAVKLTKPITITDVETGLQTTCQLIIDSACPVNLMGRDLMGKLKVNLTVTKKGDMVSYIDPPVKNDKVFVTQGTGEPYYYWTMDLTDLDQTKILMEQATTALTKMQVKMKLDFMALNALHHTLRYKETPGPDPVYDEQVHRLPTKSSISLTYLLVADTGHSCITVVLNPKQQFVNRNPYPHVSLTKAKDTHWKNMFLLVKKAERCKFSGPDEEGWEKDEDEGVWRKPIQLYIAATPATHLTEH